MALATLPRRPATSLPRLVAFLVTGGVAACALLAAAVSFVTPQVPGFPDVVTFPLADIPEVEPVFFRPFDMGTSAHGILFGIWLVRDGDGVIALYSRDDHPRRCAIERYNATQSFDGRGVFRSGSVGLVSMQRAMQCPSWVWSRTGALLFGGSRDMDRFDAAIEGELVRIDVSRIRLGNLGAGVTCVAGPCPPPAGNATPQYRRTRWPLVPHF